MLSLVGNHEYLIPTKFNDNLKSGYRKKQKIRSGEEVENVKSLRRRVTYGGRRTTRYDNRSLELCSGNEIVHQISSQGVYELRVELGDFDFNYRHAVYSNFKIGSESDGFRLTYDKFDHGSAGDSLKTAKNMKFTTMDKDQDTHNGANCAGNPRNPGAWWHKACFDGRLTGAYYKSPKVFVSYFTSLSLVIMFCFDEKYLLPLLYLFVGICLHNSSVQVILLSILRYFLIVHPLKCRKDLTCKKVSYASYVGSLISLVIAGAVLIPLGREFLFGNISNVIKEHHVIFLRHFLFVLIL
ncbi:hypothetical protein FSP39_009690 [Pinctada imbricata]|uniref:Fibrinogen C-terminal domain-containing protein n=1 Tax=Pinctada imbricata TaxID=66713 RepID=A0AA88Y007_PINIB|nr:hypothetical protein FSP39_009690 [Pinctada imbricata]